MLQKNINNLQVRKSGRKAAVKSPGTRDTTSPVFHGNDVLQVVTLIAINYLWLALISAGIAFPVASALVNYGILDMTLHDQYDPSGNKTTTDAVKEVYNQVMPYKHLEGTNFQAAFGHLNGYGAGYYGYMWSKVYAEDMFSVFEKNGILDQKTGIRYRNAVLANGGSKDEFEMVKDFLGRDPDPAAFFRSLGL